MKKTLFHGSIKNIPVGQILKSQKNGYVQKKWSSELEQLFESVKPSTYLSRNDSVFLTDNEDDIDALGGYTDYIFTVEAEEPILKCDLAWYSKADEHLQNDNTQEAIKCAISYWEQEPFYILEQSCFEILAKSAKIISVDSY